MAATLKRLYLGAAYEASPLIADNAKNIHSVVSEFFPRLIYGGGLVFLPPIFLGRLPGSRLRGNCYLNLGRIRREVRFGCAKISQSPPKNEGQ